MLSNLDPYTKYENVRETSSLRNSLDGNYGGVGVVIADDGKNFEGVLIIDAFENNAFNYGLRVGDRIVSIDNVDIRGFKLGRF